MGRINVLDKHLASLIAAGEVVQRSGSVIKELVENSIDAGADSIIIEIKAGGSAFMRVTDNGCGMSEDDARLCLLRHATSKLSDASGLEAIMSLGFRGEALASICAVSRMEIITRTCDDDAGVSVRSEGGEIVSVTKAGCPVGTTVVVRDLFFNTPARLKFLKRDATEAAHIADLVERIALGNPSIAIKLIKDGKTVLQTYGDGDVKSVTYAVWGKKAVDGMVPVEYERSGIKVTGLTCAPYAAKNNRSFQNFYINGRYVRSPLLSAALSEAYNPNLFTGKFPMCVLYVTLPPANVDVNVDPEKLTVKFSQERDLYDAVYFAVKSALIEKNTKDAQINVQKSAPVQKKLKPEDVQDFKPVQTMFTNLQPETSGKQEEETIKPTEKKDDKPELIPFVPFSAISSVGRDTSLRQKNPLMGSTNADTFVPVFEPKSDLISEKEEDTSNNEDAPVFTVKEVVMDDDKKGDEKKEPSFEIKTFEKVEDVKTEDTSEDVPETMDVINITGEPEQDITIIGELYKTYIIAMCGDVTYLIDKHAAHERIIFERIRGRGTPSSQMLLQPQSVTLSPKDFARLMENRECFESIGFEIEEFGGNTALVRAVPYDMADSDVEDAIYEIVEQLKRTSGRLSADSPVDEMLKTVACKAAIKAGYTTSRREMEVLVKDVLSDENYRYCPHGRPTYLKLTEDDLKKQFSRT